MKSSGREEVGKNCCCNECHAAIAAAKTRNRRRDHQPAPPDRPAHWDRSPRKGGCYRRAREAAQMRFGQGCASPDTGRRTTATTQETMSARPTTPEDVPAYSPAVDLAKAHGQEPGRRHKRARQHWEGRRIPREGRRPQLVEPFSILTTFISTAIIASSTSKPSAMMRAPSVIRSRFIPLANIRRTRWRVQSGTESAHHNSGTEPERKEADNEHDGPRLRRTRSKIRRPSLRQPAADPRLLNINPERDIGPDIRAGCFKGTPELEHVCVFRMETATPTAGLHGASPETQRDLHTRVARLRCRRAGTFARRLPPERPEFASSLVKPPLTRTAILSALYQSHPPTTSRSVRQWR